MNELKRNLRSKVNLLQILSAHRNSCECDRLQRHLAQAMLQNAAFTAGRAVTLLEMVGGASLPKPCKANRTSWSILKRAEMN
jgi:hypothetical protein